MIRREFRILDVTNDNGNHLYYPQVRRGILGLLGVWRYIQLSCDWLSPDSCERKSKKEAEEAIEWYKEHNVSPIKKEILKVQ